MQFTVKASNLKEAVKNVLAFLPKTSIHPVLGSVKVTVNEGTIELTATNLSQTIEVGIHLDDDNAVIGEYVCHPSIFCLLPFAVADDDFSLLIEEMDQGDGMPELRASVRCGDRQFTTSTGVMLSSEFPDCPNNLQGEASLNFEPKELSKILKAVLFAASSEPTKHILQGINFSIGSDKNLQVAATDGHRLAWYSLPTEIEIEEFTIAAASLQAVNRLIDVKDKDLIEMTTGKGGVDSLWSDAPAVRFRVKNYTLTSSVMTGQFPRWQQLVPNQFKYEFSASVGDLVSLLQPALVVAEIKNSIVMLRLDEGTLTVGARGDMGAIYGNMEVNEADSISDLIWAVNGGYFKQFLSSCDPKATINFNFNGGTSPIVINVAGIEQNHLLMPLQVREGESEGVEAIRKAGSPKKVEAVAPEPVEKIVKPKKARQKKVAVAA